MDNVLQFKPKTSGELQLLLRLSTEIDNVVISYLKRDVDARSVAGVLAHRLGTLLGTQKNDILNDLCAKIITDRISK